MNRQYVISLDGKYIKLLEYDNKIEAVGSIREATFFDSEQDAYETMSKNKQAFYTPFDLFYKIECVVIVWGG
jgi:hypothetical protein